MSELREVYRQCAELCLDAGINIDDSPGGAVHRWVAKNVSHRPETAFFIVLGICCEMADAKARRLGFDNQAHMILTRIKEERRAR